ncbi:MAG: hypothetical protein EBZ61_02690 [Micrococcales bacterium]|nr:hypothetical protein [Micrococcales bacterium]
MRNPETNKGTMKMTTKKLLTVFTALLLAVLPIHGLTAANANGVDTSLATFTIEGSDVEDGDVIIVPAGTTNVTVVATPTDPAASVVVTKPNPLQTFDNDVVVEVTGSDGITKQTYTVNVYVTDKAPGFSTDATLGSLRVNGATINPGDVVEVAPLTSAVTVAVTPNDVAATSVVSGARNLSTGMNTVSVVITAEDGVTTRSYTFKVLVLALSSNVSLETFSVNGQAVRNGGRIFLEPGTTAVTAVASPVDPTSSVQVTGSTGLQAGENTLTATVTSQSGATATYTVKLIVQVPSSISSLVVFKVSGARVVDGSTVLLPAGTEAVAVTAIPSDATASVSITGSSGLVVGDNNLSVVVTAEDGSTSTYAVTLRVLKDDDTSLAVFQYDGSDVADGDSFDLEYGTESVEIVAEATSATSTVEVLGATGLVSGRNLVRVNVTAQDESVRTYRLIFNVARNTDTSLESVTVAGKDATGGSVEVPFGTRAVFVSAVTTDPYAYYEVKGNDELQTGENTVTITVTAADGETSADVEITVTVLEFVPGTDTSLESLTVSGQEVSAGGSVEVPFGTRGVVVTAVTTDPFATYEVKDNTDLQPGENTVTVTVTAADGETTGDVEVTVVVKEQTLGTDTSLESLSVAGVNVVAGGSLEVPFGTRAVTVAVVTTDPFASYEVNGNTDLQTGENTVTVTVTAADGETTEDVEVTVVVKEKELSQNAGLESVSVAGKVVAAGSSVDAPLGTRAVSVVVITADPYATYEVDGNTELVPGENTITITVTAQDGETTAEYTVAVVIPELSDDASLALFQVNGADVEDGAQIELPYGTKSVNVKVETSDANASFAITGDGKSKALVVGDQDLVVTVTAANGDSTDYTVTLTVLPLSENANLDADAGLVVNGESVDFELLNSAGYFNVPLSTTTVNVKVQAEDYTSDVFVNTKTVLPGVARNFSVDQGVNNLSIKVVPQAGEAFAKTYVLKVYVGGADATLKTVRVNTSNIAFNNSNEGGLSSPLANGTKTATLFVDPTVALAVGAGVGTKLDFDGGDATVTKAAAANTWNVSGLVTGDNPITITVTPGDANAEQVTYTVNIPVDLSSDAGLKTFKINGVVYPVGSTQVLELGTTEVEIDGETNSDVATFEVSGGDALVPGLNTLTITVTAEKGNTADYKVTAIVPRGKEVAVVGFPKVGVVTIDAKTNKPGNTALTALVKKLTTLKANVVSVTITNNFLIAKDKPAAGTARATAVQKFLQAAKVNGVKTAKYQLLPGLKTQKGTTITVIYW